VVIGTDCIGGCKSKFVYKLVVTFFLDVINIKIEILPFKIVTGIMGHPVLHGNYVSYHMIAATIVAPLPHTP
jgi:hypothetical protein